MAAIPFTEEQVAAIDRRDSSLFLAAAAGSGKTAVLVERFVAAVRDGVEIDRMLAITFTDKAAAQLKRRVRDAFAAAGEEDLAREAEGARISTIHSLCARILRAHALAAGIDPDFTQLPEAEMPRVKREAFDAALAEFLAGGDPERLDLVAAERRPEALRETIEALHSKLRSAGKRAPSLTPPAPPPLETRRSDLEQAVKDAAAELAAERDPGVRVREAIEKLDRCAAALADLPPDAVGDYALFEGLQLGTGAGALRTDAVGAANRALESWAELCRAHAASRRATLLDELLRAHGEAYERAKRERSQLDFEDLELAVRDLLRGDPGLLAHYQARFDHLMVDEFQDTNRLQAEIIDLIAGGGCRLFAVGDSCQAIYLFRHADVGAFDARLELAEDAGELARLARNFRSRPEVIDVLNRAAPGLLGDMFAPLVAGRDGDAQAAGEARVELLATDNDTGRWRDGLAAGDHPFGEGFGETPLWRIAEARLLAKRVRELLDEGRFDESDVAVLFRATGDMWVYERALEDLDVRTYIVGGRGYWTQQQVGDLRAYLAALANPLDEEALLSVLASPLVGLSLDGVALTGMAARRSGGLWRTLERCFGDSETQDGRPDTVLADLAEEDRGRIESFVGWFPREHAAVPRLSLEQVLDRAITASGYAQRVLSAAGGRRRMANIRKLMRLAREFEAERGRDLRGFIDHVGEQAASEAREAEAALEAEEGDPEAGAVDVGAVRLMTIHAAKGLEFPVVCLADAGRGGVDDKWPWRLTGDGEIALRLVGLDRSKVSAPGFDDLRDAQRKLADQEERRIFYVALTRARERLIVSGAVDMEGWPGPRLLGNPMDWLWPELAPALRELAEAGRAEDERGGVRIVVSRPPGEDGALGTVEQVLPAEYRNPQPRGVRDEDREWPPPRPPFAPVTAPEPLAVTRLSYSSLESYRECGYRFYLGRALELPRPEEAAGAVADTEGGGLSGVVRGTIVHELLEALDFSRAAVPAAEAVRARLEAHRVAVRDADVEDLRGMVESFLGSALFERLHRCAPVRAELPFAFELRPGGRQGRSVAVSGLVDVLAVDGDTTLVVDYKSDRLEGESPEDRCARRYLTQRRVYGLAALRSGAERVEVIHLFLERPDELATVTYTGADADRLERELLELAAGVIDGEFPVSETPHRDLCAGCPGEGGLCSWPLERTRAERVEADAA